MKHLITIMMAVLLTACGHRASQQAEVSADDSTEVAKAAEFSTKNIGRQQEDSMVSVSVSVDWPVDGPDSLVAAIRRYICEEMAVDMMQEQEPKVQYFDDGKKAVDATFQHKHKQLLALRNDISSKNDDNPIPVEMTFSYYLRVKLLEETDRYITYLTSGEGFMGGAHGYATATGETFRKSDGLRIGYTSKFNESKGSYDIHKQTLFKDPRAKELNALLKDGLKSYFNEFQEGAMSDDDLRDQLLDVDVNNIPLPANPPIFTKSGLSFTYQQYEIAAYAAGMPSFNIPYDKIKGCLTDEAISVIP